VKFVKLAANFKENKKGVKNIFTPSDI